MELPVLVVAVVAGAAVAAWSSARHRRDATPARGRWSAAPRAGTAMRERGTVVLDLEVRNADAPAVERLAESLAHDALAADPELPTVRVVDATGRLLRVVERPGPLPEISIPAVAQELRPRPTRRPSVVERPSEGPPVAVPRDDGPVETVHRDLVSRFDLPPEVRAAVADPDDGTELVRALLAAAGHDVRVDRGVVRTGDEGVVVLGGVHGPGLTAGDLSDAFLRYQHSGARRGVAILLGYVPPAELRRRQTLAPDLVYVDAGAIQRMADAVALGADPLRFATVAPASR